MAVHILEPQGLPINKSARVKAALLVGEVTLYGPRGSSVERSLARALSSALAIVRS
jgi:hypothetical protein